MTDESVTKFAKRYRELACAALVQIVRDESAPANARAQAARDILSYSDGRPSTAKPISRADLHNLDEATKRDLFDALLIHFSGTGLEALMADLIPGFAGLVDPPALRKALPPPTKKTKKTNHPVPKNRFTRGPPKRRERHHPPDWGEGGIARPAAALPSDARKADLGIPTAANPEQGPAGAAEGGDPRLLPAASLLPTLGLAGDLEPVRRDAYGNILNLAALRPAGSS